MNDNTSNNITPSLEFVRRQWTEIIDWYKSADLKANIILTLDGAFLTFVSVSLVSQVEELGQVPLYTLILLGLMVVTLTISLCCAIACIWSRIIPRGEIKDLFKKWKVDITDHTTYSPKTSWFFQTISALNETEFEKKMKMVDSSFERDAIAYQIYKVSGNVLDKHKYVNYGFTFAVATLLLFLASAVTFFLHQPGIL